MKLRKKTTTQPRAIDVLISSGPLNMDVERRSKMTISCNDTAEIPKVKNAGNILKHKGKKVQVMHNGTMVLAGGYYGEWMEQIIKQLKGHHEPQEEKAFYHVLQRLNKKQPVMIELGSFWAYYSLWFKSAFPDGTAVCCEPDPTNLQLGRANMALNGFNESKNLLFVQAAAGHEDGKKVLLELDSERGKTFEAVIRSVDSIAQEQSFKTVDILHMDVQGVELSALEGAKQMINSGKVRFLVVSTHHYVFSGDPMTHHKCEQFILEHGGHIITSHNVIQSFSGDGLIVASFDKQDKDFHVAISVNTGQALFRPYELDIATMMQAYEKNIHRS
ncbi:MAG: hypothetical protein JWO41_164 [Candidatus Saccharibacteria bacterium]|nr:hypothetical protein [Candidatus Saccharibacteria bacterium]